MKHETKHHSAFTLVELSIVLVILGLLVGGIFAGAAVLKSAELKTVISDYTKYTAATAQFNRQYGGLPGDLLDATDYWGDDNTNCPDAAVANGTPGTCNGSGDGIIYMSNDESLRAWQHLLLAKLIDGNYPGTGTIAVGSNLPPTRIRNAGWSIIDSGAFAYGSDGYDNNIGNALTFGSLVSGPFDNYGVAFTLTLGSALTPSEALQIDKKMDDSLPAKGRIVALKPATLTPNCTTSATDATAAYNLAYTSKACSLMMSLSK